VSTSRCTVVRPQKPPYQHMTTDYHDWTDGSGRCKFCRLTRAQAQGHEIIAPHHDSRRWACILDLVKRRRK